MTQRSSRRAPVEPSGFFNFADDGKSRVASGGGMAMELNPRRSGSVQQSRQRGSDPDGQRSLRNRDRARNNRNRNNDPEVGVARASTEVAAVSAVSVPSSHIEAAVVQAEPIPAATRSAFRSNPRSQRQVINTASGRQRQVGFATTVSSSPSVASSSSSVSSSSGSRGTQDSSPWACSACTFVNSKNSHKCEVCETAKDAPVPNQGTRSNQGSVAAEEEEEIIIPPSATGMTNPPRSEPEEEDIVVDPEYSDKVEGVDTTDGTETETGSGHLEEVTIRMRPAEPRGAAPGTDSGAGSTWTCSTCTYRNHADLATCEVCHTSKEAENVQQPAQRTDDYHQPRQPSGGDSPVVHAVRDSSERPNEPKPSLPMDTALPDANDVAQTENESKPVPSPVSSPKKKRVPLNKDVGMPGISGRAEFVCAVIWRESTNDKLGIGVKSKAGKLLVSSIKPDGPFDKTPLRVGDRVLKINDKSFIHPKGEDEIVTLLRSHVGRLTILAHNQGGESNLVETTVKRPSSAKSKTPMGFGMRQNSATDLEVGKAEGLFTDSPVEAGDRIAAVNQVKCVGLSMDEVNVALRRSRRSLTLRTRPQKTIHNEFQLGEPGTSDGNVRGDDVRGRPERAAQDSQPSPQQDLLNAKQLKAKPVPSPRASPKKINHAGDKGRPAEFVCSVIWRQSTNEKLGIGIKSKNGKLLISRINPDGPFDKTPLQVGDRLLKINDVSLVDADENDVVGLLRSHMGRLTILAHNEQDGESSVVETMVKRPSSTVSKTPMGIGMRQNVGNELQVSKADGLFTDAFVDPGDKIVAVNQVECKDLSMREVNDVIRQSRRTLMLRTKPRRSVHEEFMLGEAPHSSSHFDI